MKGGRNDRQVGQADVPSILASVVQTSNDESAAAVEQSWMSFPPHLSQVHLLY